MYIKLTKSQALKEFENRKKKNLELIKKMAIEVKDKGENLKGQVLIALSDRGEPAGCFCSYCMEYIPSLDPWKTGVYIFPTCKECLLNASYIENRQEKGGKKRRTRNCPEDTVIDWRYVDTIIDNNQAKLSLLSKKYNLDSVDMRRLICKHYGDKVVFKRGRLGGIMWKNKK